MSKIKWNTIKEAREGYFVEYYPPSENSISFALVQLIWTQEQSLENVGETMAAEFEYWIRRFEVPTMVSAFDSKGDLIDLEDSTGSSHFMGFRSADGLKKTWGMIQEHELPCAQMKLHHWKEVFSEIPFKTTDDFEKDAVEHRRGISIAVGLLFVWLVVVPASVALLGWASPAIGAVVLIYSLGKATMTGLRLFGKQPQSARELEESEKKRKMKHYFYHCERNPKAFEQLKFENFENEERQRIKNEFDEVRASTELTGQNARDIIG
ncbi:MAG: hypothetical protein ACSHYF_11955 [Verrucomicrobiaceae bacterium]